jgi:hypothetical protein
VGNKSEKYFKLIALGGYPGHVCSPELPESLSLKPQFDFVESCTSQVHLSTERFP